MSKILTGVCPDPECKRQLFFQPEANSTIECTNCGQKHKQNNLLNIEPVSNKCQALQLLQNIVLGNVPQHVKKSSDFVKVRGLSNHGCKLISPLLTKYGLHKESQEVRLLRDMGQGETFDCSLVADRAFLIEEKNLLIPGYGKDAAAEYLKNTLAEIAKVNNGEERLVPIHADGDGHCLSHAISRAVVGHELFWHPLLTNLKQHFIAHKDDYQKLFKEFIEESEWRDIIEESDPYFVPTYNEMHGLRNIHIFGLANVLHRPIVLVDNLEGMESKGDYSALFLPGLIPFEKCKNKHGQLHKPIAISWSNKGRNHFIPLVGIQGKELPLFPSSLLPKVWGLPQDLLTKYIEFENGCCVIGGGNSLQERYLMKLVDAMERHFYKLNGVSPSVVTDVYHHIFRPACVTNISMQIVTESASMMVKEERLFKCLLCQFVVEDKMPCPMTWLEPGGELYEIAKKTHGTLKDGFKYKFPVHNILCSYNKERNKLLYITDVNSKQCPHCKGSLRLVRTDGTLMYLNGDQLMNPASSSSKCGCGFKHYWDGKEYDNLPEKIPIELTWNDQTINDFVYWFQNESDASLNSNAFNIATQVVQNYFPGEFGSDNLVRNVVDQIFTHVARNLSENSSTFSSSITNEPSTSTTSTTQTNGMTVDSPSYPSKIILTEEKLKTLHKEELTASQQEKIIKKKIEHGASSKQKRTSSTPLNQEPNETLAQKNNEHQVTSPSREKIKKSNATQKVVRVACEDQGHKMFKFTDTTRFSDVQDFIQNSFNLYKNEQIIRYGFPPKVLEPQFDSSGKELPISLKHGDRLTVHKIKEQLPEVEPMDFSDNVSSVIEPESGIKERNVIKLAGSLFSLFDKVDLWERGCTQRQLFQVNGIFYKMAFRDLGLLMDDQHLSLPCFPNRIFAYNQNDDEIVLCLGSKHICVQPLTEVENRLAIEQGKLKQHELRVHTDNRTLNKPALNTQTELKAMNTNETNNSAETNDGDDIPTIRETIDFADFKIEPEYKRKEDT